MADSRDRSRHRGMETRNRYELQDMQTSHRGPTGENSTAYSEDSYDDHNQGHPQNSRPCHLDKRLQRTCKERLVIALGLCKARSAGILRMCMEASTKYRITTVFITSIILIFLILAFRGYSPSTKPFDYELGWNTWEPMGHYRSTTTVTSSSTLYHTIGVHYKQFYDARPVHHQVPMVVPPTTEPMGQANRQNLLFPHVETGTTASVSGLYFVPMSLPSGHWPQTQQDSHPSAHPTSNTQASQCMQGSPSMEDLEPDVKPPLQSRNAGALRNPFTRQADTNTTSFTRWGVGVLYNVRRHGRRSLHIDKGWCIENVCSPHKQLYSMCSVTSVISDSFRKQECNWCWPEDQRKHEEVRIF